MWQKRFEELKSEGFTIVGIAMEAEGIEPAKMYYEKHGVTFPALVDPNFETGFGYVPWTFFVDEHGVVRAKGDIWKSLIKPDDELKPVTPEVLTKWSDSESRFKPEAIAELRKTQQENPDDLSAATDLASRYLTLGETKDAEIVLQAAVDAYDAKAAAKTGSRELRALLSRAYLLLSRAEKGDRDAQLKAARTAYFLAPTIGLAKQISRIADPTKFDDRPDGKLDNPYRNNYAKEIQKDREVWLKSD
ncbi:MAG: TlpA disulfide reductase family protein [Verrucomicrobiota bacterium]